MTDTSVATAADYADAMLVARRAKSTLVLLLLLMLLIQLGLFFTARYSNFLAAPTVEAATQPVDGTTLAARHKAVDLIHYVTGASAFLGVVFSVMLAAVLYLLVKIMLVGRLIGVARVTSAYVWSLLLILLLFPWQTYLADPTYHDANFMLPGVLYTWSEVLQSARFETTNWNLAALKWTRFVAAPVLTVILLMMIQIKSNRGLRQALGEDDLSALTNPNA